MNVMFRLVAKFVGLGTGEKLDYPMMQNHRMFAELKRWLRRNIIKEIRSDEVLRSVRLEVQKFKSFVKELFDVRG